jgi:hypothetical protein
MSRAPGLIASLGAALTIMGSAAAQTPPAKPHPSDYPVFVQSFDGPLVVLATNPGSRRWSCNASWLEGYDTFGVLTTRTEAAHFYVHPHAMRELALRYVIPPAEKFTVLAQASIECAWL